MIAVRPSTIVWRVVSRSLPVLGPVYAAIRNDLEVALVLTAGSLPVLCALLKNVPAQPIRAALNRIWMSRRELVTTVVGVLFIAGGFIATASSLLDRSPKFNDRTSVAWRRWMGVDGAAWRWRLFPAVEFDPSIVRITVPRVTMLAPDGKRCPDRVRMRQAIADAIDKAGLKEGDSLVVCVALSGDEGIEPILTALEKIPPGCRVVFAAKGERGTDGVWKHELPGQLFAKLSEREDSAPYAHADYYDDDDSQVQTVIWAVPLGADPQFPRSDDPKPISLRIAQLRAPNAHAKDETATSFSGGLFWIPPPSPAWRESAVRSSHLTAPNAAQVQHRVVTIGVKGDETGAEDRAFELPNGEFMGQATFHSYLAIAIERGLGIRWIPRWVYTCESALLALFSVASLIVIGYKSADHDRSALRTSAWATRWLAFAVVARFAVAVFLARFPLKRGGVWVDVLPFAALAVLYAVWIHLSTRVLLARIGHAPLSSPDLTNAVTPQDGGLPVPGPFDREDGPAGE